MIKVRLEGEPVEVEEFRMFLETVPRLSMAGLSGGRALKAKQKLIGYKRR